MKKVLGLFILAALTLCLVGFQPTAPVSVLTISTDGELFTYYVSEESLAVDVLTAEYEPRASLPTWSHDGQYLAFVSWTEEATVIRIRRPDGSLHSISTPSQPSAMAWSQDDSKLAFTTANDTNPFSLYVSHLHGDQQNPVSDQGLRQYQISNSVAGCCIEWISSDELVFIERPSNAHQIATLDGLGGVTISPVGDSSLYFGWKELINQIDELPLDEPPLKDMVAFDAVWNADHTWLAVYLNDQNKPMRNRPTVKVAIFELNADGGIDIRFIHSGEYFGGFSWNPVTPN